jgi:hypothetical protein
MKQKEKPLVVPQLPNVTPEFQKKLIASCTKLQKELKKQFGLDVTVTPTFSNIGNGFVMWKVIGKKEKVISFSI